MKRRIFWCENCKEPRLSFNDHSDEGDKEAEHTKNITYFMDGGSCAKCGGQITENQIHPLH